jgi:hypothetical protein
MNRKRLLILAGGLGVVALATGCPGEDTDVRKYLGTSGGPHGLYAWEQKVGEAICQLEVNNPTGLDPAKQICPGGPGGITPPPSYPPP